MVLPDWVQSAIKNLEPPKTGKVVIEIECYMGGVTKMEIGGHLRVKPPDGEKSPGYLAEEELYHKGRLAGLPAYDK